MPAFRVRPWDRWASRLATNIRPVALEAAPRRRAPPKHDLILYDFEASPWCRLVREYATILDLTLHIKPCPRETLLFGEGSFGPESRFRPHAMQWHQQKTDKASNDNLTFPLLVDRTNRLSRKDDTKTPTTGMDHYDDDNDTAGTVILTESYEILTHLWDRYGDSVLSTKGRLRPDQMANAPDRAFAARFFSLAGPSYLRPWPRCGLLRFPSQRVGTTTNTQEPQITLYQAEGCPDSRLVREALCCLEIPYRSIPVALGSWNSLPPATPGSSRTEIPILQVVAEEDGSDLAESSTKTFVGSDECLDYLRETYYYKKEDANHANGPRSTPTWFDPLPSDNRGRSGGSNFSVLTAALAALRTGRRNFVPDKALR